MTSSAFVPAQAATSSARRVSGAKTDLVRNAARAARGNVHRAFGRLTRSGAAEARAAARSLAWYCSDFIRRTGLSPERCTVDPRGRIVISGSRPAFESVTGR